MSYYLEPIGNAIGHFVSVIGALDWMQLLLLVMIAFLGFVLWRCQVEPDDFDLRQLMCDPLTNKIDRFAFGYLVGLIVLSWAVLVHCMGQKLPEWLAFAYVVYCGAPKSIEVWINAKKGV